MRYSPLLFCVLLLACQQTTSSETAATASATTEHDILRYQEKHRPQVHFSPDSMWMNDPNGMVYFDKTYHLFYQYYPDSNVWGPMHWGHAISHDLIRWEHLPIALAPDEKGYIFSGGAVVDAENTSGFQVGDTTPLVAFFTYHDPAGEQAGRVDFQSQGIAYSLDGGYTWEKYAQNPVLPNPGIRDFRDPKVMWHAETEQWIMTLAAGNEIQFYQSPDLKSWEFASAFGANPMQGSHGGVWECPDLFPLRLNGQTHWVLLVSIGDGGPNGGSATQYFIGQFDGTRFVRDRSAEEIQWLDHGKDNYAGVTWSGVPQGDGRQLFIGWMSNWQYAREVPTERWRSAMTLPRTLDLQLGDSLPYLISHPVVETRLLRNPKQALKPRTIRNRFQFAKLDANPMELDLLLQWEDSTITEVGLRVKNELGDELRIAYQPMDERLLVDRRKSGQVDFATNFAESIQVAPCTVDSSGLHLHVLLDVSSVEVFAQEGQTVMTELLFPRSPLNQYELYVQGGEMELVAGTAWPLQSIWMRPQITGRD